MILPNQRIKLTIKFISAGDTLKLNYNGQDFHGRARWIDAPEIKNQSNTRKLSLYTGIIKNCAKAYKLNSGFWEDNILLPYEVKKLE